MTGKEGTARRMNMADEVLAPPLARGQANQAAMMVEDQEITYGELNARMNRLGPGQRIFSASKMFYAYGLAHALVGALRFGATIVPSCIFSVVSIDQN